MTAPAPDFDAAREATASERAMADIDAALDSFDGNNALRVIMEISRISGNYSMKRIGEP